MADVLFGTVNDNVDEEGLGRVQVLLSDHGDEVILPWIRVIQALGSSDSGLVWLPEIDDNVVVLCGPGGVDGMVVLGCLYSGNRMPPGEAKVEHKHLLTMGGNEILIDDTDGAEQIKIATKDGIEILIDNATPSITITAGSEITVTADDTITVEAADIVLTGSSSITIDGGSNPVEVLGSDIDVTGSGTVKISGSSVELG